MREQINYRQNEYFKQRPIVPQTVFIVAAIPSAMNSYCFQSSTSIKKWHRFKQITSRVFDWNNRPSYSSLRASLMLMMSLGIYRCFGMTGINSLNKYVVWLRRIVRVNSCKHSAWTLTIIWMRIRISSKRLRKLIDLNY